jgi:hypothetical protein
MPNTGRFAGRRRRAADVTAQQAATLEAVPVGGARCIDIARQLQRTPDGTRAALYALQQKGLVTKRGPLWAKTNTEEG